MTESTFIHRPALLSLAVIKIFIKRNLGREETMYLVYIVQVTVHEEIEGRNLRHEPGDRNWSKHHRRLLPTCLFHLTCSTCFLIPRSTTCTGATTHCGMEPSTSIINQVNGPQTGLQNIMLEAFSYLGVHSSKRALVGVKLTKTLVNSLLTLLFDMASPTEPEFIYIDDFTCNPQEFSLFLPNIKILDFHHQPYLFSWVLDIETNTLC